MPPVSRRYLKPEIYNRLIDIFIQVLSTTNQTKSGLLFTHTLLSATERTMLAKRVGISLLLKRGYSYDMIMDYLKVSRGTVAKVSEIIHSSDQESQVVLDKIINNKQISETMGKLDYYLSRLIPPNGRNWSNWRSKIEKDRRKSEQPI